MTELDTQIGGTHYTDMKIQPLEYSMANNLNACEHSVLKYISRHKQKGGREDLLKARDMLDKLIEFEYPDPTKAEEPDEELCTDEGCIKYGTSHVCYEPEIMPAKVFR
ncbi:MAG: DUF3310 domain-containing protein [Oleispira sp.]|nr:DUF3310 domain-containing protein [Oleispira sp.]